MAQRVMGEKVWRHPITRVWFQGDNSYRATDPIPHYTTDIAAAWRIVDRMGRQGYGCTFTIDRPDSICVLFWGGPLGNEERGATDSTAPLAICRAALAALGQPR